MEAADRVRCRWSGPAHIGHHGSLAHAAALSEEAVELGQQLEGTTCLWLCSGARACSRFRVVRRQLMLWCGVVNCGVSWCGALGCGGGGYSVPVILYVRWGTRPLCVQSRAEPRRARSARSACACAWRFPSSLSRKPYRQTNSCRSVGCCSACAVVASAEFLDGDGSSLLSSRISASHCFPPSRSVYPPSRRRPSLSFQGARGRRAAAGLSSRCEGVALVFQHPHHLRSQLGGDRC